MPPSDPSSPVFAIIIPTYNRPDLIHRSLESALAQNYPHWLAIVSDDGSSKDYTAVKAQFTIPKIHFIANPKNSGCNQARNLAIDEAIRLGASHLVLLDDKDMLAPDALTQADHQIRAHPDYGWFISNTFGDSKPSSRPIIQEQACDWIDDYSYGKTLRGDKTHVIALSLLREDIRFDGRYRTSNMWPFYMSLSTRTKIWAYPYASKKIHYLAGGITKTSSRYPKNWLEIYSRFARHAYAIRLRPGKISAYKHLLLELLKTPKRILYLYFKSKRNASKK